MEKTNEIKQGHSCICISDYDFDYEAILTVIFHLPQQFRRMFGINFPKKDELGGEVFRFDDGGGAYFKVLDEMPSFDEVESIADVCNYLHKLFDGSVTACLLYNGGLDVKTDLMVLNNNVRMKYASLTAIDGDEVVDELLSKLENGEDFSFINYLDKAFLPYTRHESDQFESKYSKLLDLFDEVEMEWLGVMFSAFPIFPSPDDLEDS